MEKRIEKKYIFKVKKSQKSFAIHLLDFFTWCKNNFWEFSQLLRKKIVCNILRTMTGKNLIFQG